MGECRKSHCAGEFRIKIPISKEMCIVLFLMLGFFINLSCITVVKEEQAAIPRVYQNRGHILLRL